MNTYLNFDKMDKDFFDECDRLEAFKLSNERELEQTK